MSQGLSSATSSYLASKPRFEALDGLRGVAALIVVAFHLCETYYKSGPDQPFNHGYLAVDFFFCLSGFVIAYAYDDRWQQMSLFGFVKRRLIRLHPMAVFGTLVGALLFYLGAACSEFGPIASTGVGTLMLTTVLGMLLLPLPPSMDVRGWAETTPLNGPAWTLQWEYLANILYAVVFRRASKAVLAICVALFACLTVMLCFNIDPFGTLAARAYASYTVVGGWSLTPDQLQIGATRLLYPFFCGLLIARCGRYIRVRGGFWTCAVVMVVLLAMPWMGLGAEGAQRWTNGLYECLCILFFFPLVVAMGAGCGLDDGSGPGRKMGFGSKVVKWLGDISFPLYITHYPLVYAQMGWLEANRALPASVHICVGVGLFIFAIGLAWGAHKLFDLPAREWLRRKMF